METIETMSARFAKGQAKMTIRFKRGGYKETEIDSLYVHQDGQVIDTFHNRGTKTRADWVAELYETLREDFKVPHDEILRHVCGSYILPTADGCNNPTCPCRS